MDGFEVAAKPGDYPEDPNAFLWAGIDPGKHGYVVVLLPDDSIKSWKAPVDEDGNYILADMVRVAQTLKGMGVWHVTLEGQQPTRLRAGQKNQGAANSAVRSSFMTGYGFACWEMALTVAGFSKMAKGGEAGCTYDLAWPSHWKKKMGITVEKDFEGNRETEKKNRARRLATAQWPSHDFRISSRARLPSPDQCEAALLALYGMGRHFRDDV
jgi:hypothetical protein